MKHTGISMGGSIIHTRKAKAIPCDCNKCGHKSIIGKTKENYCSYHQILFPTNKQYCVRYCGPKVIIRKNKDSCRKCKYNNYGWCIKYKLQKPQAIKKCKQVHYNIKK